jgi:hypothetical protein
MLINACREKYVYHMGRTPLPINSNYYILDHSYWKPTDNQISRFVIGRYYYKKVFFQKVLVCICFI